MVQIPSNLASLLRNFFSLLGGAGTLLISLWIFWPEKAERLVIHFYKFLGYVSEWHERKFIQKSIENEINSRKKDLFGDPHEVMPYDLRIKWINIEHAESYLEMGKDLIIVKMKNHKNQSRNLALAVKLYVPKALLPTARRYVDPKLVEALDYVISKYLLMGDPAALALFVEEYSKLSGEDIAKIIKEVETIHEQGLLTRVLLREYQKLAKLYPREPDNAIWNESAEVEKKIYSLAVKKPEEKVDTSYLGRHIKMAVVPVARAQTIDYYGTDAHIQFIKKCLDQGIDTIYVCAAGEVNPIFAEEVVKRSISELGLCLKRKEKYRGFYRGKKRSLYIAVLSKE